MALEQNKNKEYQTVRLFATLGILTVIAVLLFKVVLFGPGNLEKSRVPAEISGVQNTIVIPTFPEAGK